MKKRILSLVLTVALLFGAMCTLIAGAETPAADLKIAYANISLRDTLVLKFALPETTEDVKLLVWTDPENDYTLATADSIVTEYNTVDKAGYMTFDYTGIAAKQMADVVYVRAYANIEGVDTYGDLINYSVLQYAYSKITAGNNAKLVAMLEDMLEYGASAQDYFDYKTDRLANAAWVEISATAGTVDGFKSGLYLAGDRVTLSAPATDAEGKEFAYWTDSAENQIADTATYEITVGAQSEVYTPVYVAVTLPPVVTTAPVTPDVPAEPEMPELPEWPAASEGIEYGYDEEYGIAFVVGIGDCTDTTIVIASEYEGYPVTDIDPSAFTGAAITAVYIPNTVTTIGDKAFRNCSALTDVYYNGTPAEWEENVTVVGRYNTPITNATKHFNPFLVTFVDYDGRVLKYEYVDYLESATAPEDPTRANYVFTGWDVDFNEVESNLTVTAQYKYDTVDPCIVISDAVAVDGVATLTVSIQNNPGIAAINLTLDETSKGLLDTAENGTILPTLDTGKNLFWSADGDCVGDGVLATLTFNVEGLDVGTYSVEFVLNEAVKGLTDIAETFTVVAGSITVK